MNSIPEISPADLDRMCAEVREWWNTGVLPEKSALADFAREHFSRFGDDAVRQAENHVVRLAVTERAANGASADARGDGSEREAKRFDLFQVHLCGENARGEIRETADGEYVEFAAYERAMRWRRRCLSVISLLDHVIETGAEPYDEDMDMVQSFKCLAERFDPSQDDLVQRALKEAREVVDACAGDNRPAPEWARKVGSRLDAALGIAPPLAEIDTVMADDVAAVLDPAWFSVEAAHKEAVDAVRNAVREGRAALSSLPDDLFSHRDAWRRGLGILRDLSEADDKPYWQHEINAYDRTFNALEALRATSHMTPLAAAEALRGLEAAAERQKDYFGRRQAELPSIEDYTNADAVLNLPDDIGPLLSQSHFNGRYSEADWWLSTVRTAISKAAGARR